MSCRDARRFSKYLLFVLGFLGTVQFKVIKAVDYDENRLPNIVVILTDDQDLALNGMTPMQKTQKLLATKGASFTNAFTSSPICCPSRASILSGQYAHNHGTINNSMSGGCYSDVWRKHIEPRAFPVHLQTNGYATFYAGKYLNEYHTTEVPPGYDEWYGLHGNSKYYNYTLTENGVSKKYGDEEEDYLTDVLSSHVNKFISKQANETPFFAMVATPAAHSPFTPAKRHEGTFDNVKAVRTPNFNVESDELDKHWLVRMPPSPLPDNIIDNIDLIYRNRWRTLLAVDEMVEKIVLQLKNLNLLENTYIVYTSDHGFHMGQFSMPYDKRQPYDTDIRVPLIVSGPEIRSKLVINNPIALIDLVPTIFDWANISRPSWVDGQSFANLLTSESNSIDKYTSTENDESNPSTERVEKYERQLLVEYWGEGTKSTYNNECPWRRDDRLYLCALDAGCHCLDAWNNTYSCIRHVANDLDKLYCEFEDKEAFVEAYDLFVDPYQITNLGFDMLPSERTQYSLHLNKLKQCEGEACEKF